MKSTFVNLAMGLFSDDTITNILLIATHDKNKSDYFKINLDYRKIEVLGYLLYIPLFRS